MTWDGEVRDIIVAAADWARVTPDVLRGPVRSQQLSRARHVAMTLCKEWLGMSYPEIGRAFAYRCHTTVMNGVKRARAGRLNREEHWLVAFEAIEGRLRRAVA